MRICPTHWDALRAAIDERGLSHLVAKDGITAMENLQDQLQGDSSSYDPLMDANLMIVNKALELGGLYLLTRKEDGTGYCPLCEANLHIGPDAAQEWIKGSTDAIREYCVQEKLVGVQ